MNNIDFNTSPAGFPLESDAILGFMQQAIIDGMLGIAELAGTNGQTIVSGCAISGTTVGNGWVMINGELLRFEGGTKQTSVIIEETATQKANEDGTLLDRIIDRKAKFGSGSPSYLWANFSRANRMTNTQKISNYIARQGGTGNEWVILQGLEVNGGGIDAGVAIKNGVYYNVPAYSVAAPTSGSPVYLDVDGNWSTSSSTGALVFDPWPDEYMERHIRNATHPEGSVLFVKNGSDVLTDWFDTGLGFGKWWDWAVADGTNSTNDLSSHMSGFTGLQRIN